MESSVINCHVTEKAVQIENAVHIKVQNDKKMVEKIRYYVHNYKGYASD